ncbi:hypothetical protein RHSIM_Rhsim11G0151500 [Rhododendron simsii]|uniref:Interferon-related developmental regulator N-terminal domain-containing protein n=1 Tax=Rhododendron simsii TaxID=118357 RepID=A0A834G650_RHOSS|nr:hypothetical protein RHSIM_Rhsim11G0151500 [Rhododendron simsii]
MGLTHILPNPQPRLPNPVARTPKPHQKTPLSYPSCSISQIPSPNSSSLSTTTKTHFNPLSKITKPEANNFPTMSEIMEASKSQKIGLEIRSVGPFFRITAKSLETRKELGRAEGLVRVWLGGKILHLDSIRLRRETLGMERSIFGIGLFVGAVAVRYGYDCGCGKAELLAINDSDLYHSKLVKFYKRIGFRAVREVTGSSLGDLSHMLVWGGIGTRMDANISELLRKYNWSKMGQKKMVERHISMKGVDLIKVDEEEAANLRKGRKKMVERRTSARADKKNRGIPVKDVDLKEYEEEAAYLRSLKTLDSYVDTGLFSKREDVREEALSEIVKAFTHSTKPEIVETKFATIMLRCLNSLKKGSAKEICLATKAIGLLAVILGPGDRASELFEESLSTFSQMLSFQAESVNVLECLAIVTLVGAEDFSDIERSMKFIWKYISSNETSTPVLAAAISAWSLLLTSVDGRQLDHKCWQGVISYFLNLLHDGESVQALCVEALGMIFEKGCVEKFSAEAYKAFMQSLDDKDNEFSYFEKWKYEIVEQVSAVCDPNWKVSKLFKEGHTLKKSIFICGNCLKLSTLAQFKKFNFIKQFLGHGFETHVMENEFLHRVLCFKVKEAPNGPELYVPENEKVTVRYFSPDIRKDKCKEWCSLVSPSEQKFERSPNSLVSKARTQLMKKHRILAQERKTGDFLAC